MWLDLICDYAEKYWYADSQLKNTHLWNHQILRPTVELSCRSHLHRSPSRKFKTEATKKSNLTFFLLFLLLYVYYVQKLSFLKYIIWLSALQIL